MASAAFSPERLHAFEADVTRERVLRTGDGQVWGEARPGQDDRRVNLVRHHPNTEPVGQLRNPAQFVDGVHRPRRVVRIAQQVRDPATR